MPSKPESLVLAEMVDSTRQLTRFYISKLKGQDMFHVFEMDGKKFNSPYWIIAHLTWAQNNLILRATGGTNPEIKWLSKFKLGSTIPPKEELPDLLEVLAGFKKVHQMSLDHIRSLDESKLDEPNVLGINLFEDSSIRGMIHHQIRHEGTHIGHLGWLAKMYGIHTF